MNINNLIASLPISTKQLKQQAALLSIMASAILLGITLIYSIWQWHSDWRLAHQEIKSTAALLPDDETLSMINALPKAHLFGENISSGNMPITSLQLRVTGIVKSLDENSHEVSKAYISMSGQAAKIYQTGDSLPYGVKVYEINNDAVILENDGHLEKLPLPRERLEFKARDTEENLQ